jgi:hypothetical protein
MRSAVLAAMILSGCGQLTYIPDPVPQFEKMPRQDEAASLIWNILLEMDGDPPPVEWVTGELCNNTDYLSIVDYTADGTKQCLAGRWKHDIVTLVIPVDHHDHPGIKWTFYSFSSMAHEFTHAKLYYLTGDLDGGHTKKEEWDKIPPIKEWLRWGGL